MSGQHTVPEGDELLSVRRLSKSFGGNVVLHDVSFDLRPGEIHALVGENGSGKSTFITCIAGSHQPAPEAEIVLCGKKLAIPYGPPDALRHGFGFVHQNLGLVPTLTVSENLALSRGFQTAPGAIVRWGAERERANRGLATFGAHIDPDSRIMDLSQADKTLVAIARGLDAGDGPRRVLVLDEPTAALPYDEVELLFAALRKLARQGVGMIYVSHRLGEVLTLADRVTALRDGHVVATVPVAHLDERKLVSLIVGRSLSTFRAEPETAAGRETILEVKGLCGRRVRDMSFSIAAGEIVGVAGLLGSGRSELGRLLFGAQQATGGHIRFLGRDVRAHRPADALSLGIGYVPEDRLGKGGIGAMTVADNLTLPDLGEFWRFGFLSRQREKKAARDLIRRYRIRPADPDARFSSLSGGNQQKAIIARALRLKPRLLILDEPVQGVDIGSKLEIYDLIRDVAQAGTAVIVIDADFEELSRLCSRLMVLREGRLAAQLEGSQRTHDSISELVHSPGSQAV